MPRRAALAMMNVVAIGLVLSTLAAAGVWSPAPTPPPSTAGEHVVREGRRVVIVEYEREHPLYPGDAVKETHVLPPDSLDGGEGRLTDKARGAVSDAADRVADAAEGGKEKMSDAKESATGKVFGAVKRCKDRLCGAAREAEEGAKDKASAGEHGAEQAVPDVLPRRGVRRRPRARGAPARPRAQLPRRARPERQPPRRARPGPRQHAAPGAKSHQSDVREDEGGEGGRQGEGHGRHRRPANGHRRGGQHGHHHHRSHGGGAQAGRQQQYGGEVGGGGGAGGRADVQEPGGDAEPAAQEAERLLVSVQRAVPDGADVAPRAPGTSPPDSQRLLGSKLFVVRVVCCESDML
ncbi:Os04g0434400 [Oryza sativa Japonica Group]|uniref:Os04g0434400 protein n=2 Tax=Oryza sativa subsp. japonica TaxID=39947 RepID=C7J0Z6_ORYSJ|nr:Os04g0434400 [Oryza sativa Japonica Group]BAS89292.1 Os04g0434400 [Oryza sativa Japonica Group]|eukprot:NP_001173952.1 Os04g0434400 [Oryza sativa Japonica Group]